MTFNIEINNKPKKDNRYLILLRITQNRKHKRISLGKYIKKSDFNPTAKFGQYCVLNLPLFKMIVIESPVVKYSGFAKVGLVC